MQKNSSEKPAGPGRTVKYILLAFVIASVGAVVYRSLPCCGGGEPAAVTAAATEQAPVVPAEAAVPVVAKKSPAPAKAAAAVVKPAAAKSAVVYYFFTNTRCSSCKTIEAYTREAVAKNFAEPYKGWRVEFRGVNVDEPANKHFIQDYWLNSKSVVVQKYDGEKALDWNLLKSVWQLLGDKEKFMAYVVDETHKVLDK